MRELRVIETKRQERERERKRERGLQQKRHEYGKFRLIVVVVVVIGLKFLKKCKMVGWDGGENINTKKYEQEKI